MATLTNSMRDVDAIISSISENNRIHAANPTLHKIWSLVPGEEYPKGRLLHKEFRGINACLGDTIYRSYYVSGLIIENGPVSDSYFLESFPHFKTHIQPGSGKINVKKVMGTALWESMEVLMYACPDTFGGEEGDVRDCAAFVFEAGKLSGIKLLYRDNDC